MLSCPQIRKIYIRIKPVRRYPSTGLIDFRLDGQYRHDDSRCILTIKNFDSSFHPEAYVAIHQGKIVDLEGLNKALQVWLDGYYHQRRHGTTQQTPAERMGSFPVKPLPYGKEELRRFFFVEETRKVDKTGCISLDGIAYEVPQELAKKKVQVRYDPFDPSSPIPSWMRPKKAGICNGENFITAGRKPHENPFSAGVRQTGMHQPGAERGHHPDAACRGDPFSGSAYRGGRQREDNAVACSDRFSPGHRLPGGLSEQRRLASSGALRRYPEGPGRNPGIFPGQTEASVAGSHECPAFKHRAPDPSSD